MSTKPKPALVGASLEAWTARLDAAAADPPQLLGELRAMQAEVSSGQELLAILQASPWYRWLIPQGQGPKLAPARKDDLASEVGRKRDLLRDRAQAALKAELPPALWNYSNTDRYYHDLDGEPRLLERVHDGLQFSGFEKYCATHGDQKRQVYTFFVEELKRNEIGEYHPGARLGPSSHWTLPSFYGTYQERQRSFTIQDVRRKSLPHGAAGLVVAEQIRTVCDPARLRKLLICDVIEANTREAFIDVSPGGGPLAGRLRTGADFWSTTLGRLARTALDELGLEATEVVPRLTHEFGPRLHFDLTLGPKVVPA